MRCASCDGILTEQVLGRLPDGRLSFGLCFSCLEAEQAVVLDRVELVGHTARSSLLGDRKKLNKLIKRSLRAEDKQRARARPAASTRPVLVLKESGRQSTMVGLAALLAAWGLLLAISGASGSGSHPGLRPSPFGNGTPALFWAGAAVLGLVALGMLATTLSKAERTRLMLRAGQVALSLVAVGVLVWGIARHNPGRDVRVVLATAAALAGAAGLRRLERGPEPGPSIANEGL